MSNLKFQGHFDDRAGALRYLDGKPSRKIAHNTTVHLTPQGDPAVRYHETDIVTYHGDGSMTLDCGGWATSTTTNRIWHFTPFVVNGRYPRSDWTQHRIEVRYGHGQDPVAVLSYAEPAARLTY